MTRHSAAQALARGAFVVTAFLLGSVGTPCEADEGSITIEDCPPDREATLQASLDEALSAVDRCLANLNPSMAQAIQALTQRGRMSIACEEVASSHGARTEHLPRGKTVIFINLTPTARGQKPVAQRLFHELIHAVDPQNRYLVSPAAHQRAGFPDPVYGCQYACFGGIGSDDADVVNNYQNTNHLAFAQAPDYPCAGVEPPFCPLLRRYAHLCRTGRPVTSPSVRETERRTELPGCLLGYLVDRCAAPCRELRGKVREMETSPNPEIRRRLMQELRGVSQRLVQALSTDDPSSLGEAERGYYQAAQRGHYYQACLE